MFVNVGVAGLNEVLGKLIHPVKVVGCVVEVDLFAVLPVKAEPVDAFLDRVNVLLVFLHRIGVVKAHVAVAAVVTRQPKVQADTLGVTDVEVAVGFRRETRADFCNVRRPLFLLLRVGRGMSAPETRQIVALGKIGLDDVAQEIGRFHGAFGTFGFLFRIGHGHDCVLFPAKGLQRLLRGVIFPF